MGAHAGPANYSTSDAPVTPEQAAALREPFKPAQIDVIPKGGVSLSYVGHANTTARLLNVDPEWTWRPFTAAELLDLPEFLRGLGLWIHLTVCGVTRPGFGDPGNSKGGNAVKEAIGDAIRNAAMRFGVALDLWAKGDTEHSALVRDTTEVDKSKVSRSKGHDTDTRWATPDMITREQVKAIYTLAKERGAVDKDKIKQAAAVVLNLQEIKSMNDLTRAQASTVINSLKGTVDNESGGSPSE